MIFTFSITVLRYLVLILLYLFLFYVVRLMFHGGLGAVSAETAGVKNAKTGRKDASVKLTGENSIGSNPRLIIIEAYKRLSKEDSVFQLDSDVVIGRGIESSIVVDDPGVSHSHCRVFLHSGQFWVEDLGSKNGTHLNEIPLVKPTVLANDDRLRTGSTVFQFLRW